MVFQRKERRKRWRVGSSLSLIITSQRKCWGRSSLADSKLSRKISVSSFDEQGQDYPQEQYKLKDEI